MKIFLCFASEEREIAERIQLTLTNANYTVFFDEQSLSPSDDFRARIHKAIEDCDIFIFLITSNSLAKGKFTHTELKFAREKWPSPVGKILPVNIGNLPIQEIPNYLTTVTILEIVGDASSEVLAAVKKMKTVRNHMKLKLMTILIMASLISFTIAPIVQKLNMPINFPFNKEAGFDDKVKLISNRIGQFGREYSNNIHSKNIQSKLKIEIDSLIRISNKRLDLFESKLIAYSFIAFGCNIIAKINMADLSNRKKLIEAKKYINYSIKFGEKAKDFADVNSKMVLVSGMPNYGKITSFQNFWKEKNSDSSIHKYDSWMSYTLSDSYSLCIFLEKNATIVCEYTEQFIIDSIQTLLEQDHEYLEKHPLRKSQSLSWLCQTKNGGDLCKN